MLQTDTSAIVTLASSGLDRPQKLDSKVYGSYGARYLRLDVSHSCATLWPQGTRCRWQLSAPQGHAAHVSASLHVSSKSLSNDRVQVNLTLHAHLHSLQTCAADVFHMTGCTWWIAAAGALPRKTVHWGLSIVKACPHHVLGLTIHV